MLSAMETSTSAEHEYFTWRPRRFTPKTVKHHTLPRVFDVIGFILSIGLVLMGYVYGKNASERIVSSPQVLQISVTPTPSSQLMIPQPEQSSDCPSGLVLSSLNSFQFCLPNTFTQESNSNTSVRFRSADEEFVVNNGALEQFPIHICNLEKKVMAGGNFATRTIFREETATGCGEIVGFATTIYETSEGNIQLHLWRGSGTYKSEEGYEKIEQSVRF